MALGDFGTNNNENGKKNFEPTYYSGLKIRNYDSKLAVGVSFNNGLMNIAIQKENDNHRYDDLIKASIPPKKALILLHEMDLMESAEDNVSRSYGITLGLSEVQTAIAFQIVNGVKYLRIAKVNSDGSIKDQKAYEFANGTDSGLQWSDFDRMTFTKDVVDGIDYQMLKNAIADFARGSSGAFGYGQLYMNRYENNVLTSKINSIMDKLGIERRSNNNNYSGGGFFNNNDSYSGTSDHKSFTQVSSMLGEDDE